MSNDKARPEGKPFGHLNPDATMSYVDAALAGFKSLAEDTVEPWLKFKASYQVDSFLSKFCSEGTVTANDRRRAAIDKWLLVESRNERTNFRVQFEDECVFAKSQRSYTSEDILRFARVVITDIIGEEPPSDILEWGQFTNGASTRVKRAPNAVALKFVGEAHVTPSAAMHFIQLLDSVPGWRALWSDAGNSLCLVESSVMFTVPKSSTIDRVACKEPEVNMFLQRACGNFIRHMLLRKARINLNDQSINQELARKGSLRRGDPDQLSLATLDLSSASDSVSEALVVRLLPPAWFCLLDDLRVKSTVIDGTVHVLNMFSSMGNGFTFELESLLFYALARATMYYTGTKGRVSVYGDDLIVPTTAAHDLRRVLEWFGFKLNSKKSFWKGPFRESCGAHWYRGHDVTPFYLRGPMLVLPDLINQLNQLREWVLRESVNGLWTYRPAEGDSICSDLVEVWNRFSRLIPKKVHGGRDLEDAFCLVTPAKPDSRLMLRGKDRLVNQMGGLLHWLQIRDRISEDAVTSIGMYIRGFTTVWNPSWAQVLPVDMLFVQELLAEGFTGRDPELTWSPCGDTPTPSDESREEVD